MHALEWPICKCFCSNKHFFPAYIIEKPFSQSVACDIDNSMSRPFLASAILLKTMEHDPSNNILYIVCRHTTVLNFYLGRIHHYSYVWTPINIVISSVKPIRYTVVVRIRIPAEWRFKCNFPINKATMTNMRVVKMCIVFIRDVLKCAQFMVLYVFTNWWLCVCVCLCMCR